MVRDVWRLQICPCIQHLPSSKKAAPKNIPTVTRLRVVAKAVVTDEVVSAQMAWNLRVADMVEQTNITMPAS